MAFKSDRQRKAVMCRLNLKHGGKLDRMFDRIQLSKGTKVEMEHTDDPEVAKAIAKAHLTENPKYYVYLEIMEAQMKGDAKLSKGDKVRFIDLYGQLREGKVTGFRTADDTDRTPVVDITSDSRQFGAPREKVMKTGNPFAGYRTFDSCVRANMDKRDPKAYCGAIKRKIEGA